MINNPKFRYYIFLSFIPLITFSLNYALALKVDVLELGIFFLAYNTIINIVQLISTPYILMSAKYFQKPEFISITKSWNSVSNIFFLLFLLLLPIAICFQSNQIILLDASILLTYLQLIFQIRSNTFNCSNQKQLYSIFSFTQQLIRMVLIIILLVSTNATALMLLIACIISQLVVQFIIFQLSESSSLSKILKLEILPNPFANMEKLFRELILTGSLYSGKNIYNTIEKYIIFAVGGPRLVASFTLLYQFSFTSFKLIASPINRYCIPKLINKQSSLKDRIKTLRTSTLTIFVLSVAIALISIFAKTLILNYTPQSYDYIVSILFIGILASGLEMI